jgi:D-threo-aldose 1-dehydrogenase
VEKRRLGRTNLRVTEIGLVGAPLGRDICSDQEAMETVWASLESGMNIIDTSPFYGRRRSESRIGRALRERPDLASACILSTKTGHYDREEHDYTFEGTLESVERSLELLGVDHLHLVHLHDIWDPEHLRQILRSKAAHAALRRLQSEGTIGAIGIGTRDLGTLQFAVESNEFDVLMIANLYNLLVQAGRTIIEEARQRDVGVILAGTYASGILAKGSADPHSNYRYRPASQEIRGRVAALEALCRKWGCSLPAAAVQFCLRGPATGAVTVLGARTPRQVEGNLNALKQEIPRGFWAEFNLN